MMEGRMILLVEDEPDIRELFALVLESAGFTVLAVADLREALEILTTQPVALLITDYELPEMSGAALIARARELRPHLPTILASGHLDAAAVAASSGIQGYYQKGLPIDQLTKLVISVLQDAQQENGDKSGNREA
ncbi:MAG: response regulator [Armatimonadota bacterium]